MKHLYLRVLILLMTIFICMIASGQPKQEDFITDHRWNGRFWDQLDDNGKSLFLAGFQDGEASFKDAYVGILQNLNVEKDEIDRLNQYTRVYFSPEWATLDDIRQQIDMFYQDRANIRIPIPAAKKYACMRLQGESAKELEAIVAQLRAMYNK